MFETFTSLLETIRFLGGLATRSKEETLTYNKLLAYAGSLATLNKLAVDNEIDRKETEDYGQAEGHPTRRT